MIANMAQLEARIKRGEDYLESRPNDKLSLDLYWRLTTEYVTLKEIEELDPLWLHLPADVFWQRKGSALRHDVVRVLFHGQVEDSADITRAELAELLATVNLVKEAR